MLTISRNDSLTTLFPSIRYLGTFSMYQPYEQGGLDSLCGVYSIVNAVRIVNSLTNEDCSSLFGKIIEHLDESRSLPAVLTSGLSLQAIGSIFKDVIGNETIQRAMPFKHYPNASLDEFWEGMRIFLADGERKAILIGLGGIYDHWTVVSKITPKQIQLFDSDGLKKLNRVKCTTKEPTLNRPHRIYPTHTYFLSS